LDFGADLLDDPSNLKTREEWGRRYPSVPSLPCDNIGKVDSGSHDFDEDLPWLGHWVRQFNEPKDLWAPERLYFNNLHPLPRENDPDKTLPRLILRR
jgi:hypothetical protein